mmetsp:Transcript_19344/g.54305  ORF Transcript_19344/g.54305 Transcript_19344/m.54305 type:complete len:102 (-) Transcript_19344:1303-1608(-)
MMVLLSTFLALPPAVTTERGIEGKKVEEEVREKEKVKVREIVFEKGIIIGSHKNKFELMVNWMLESKISPPLLPTLISIKILTFHLWIQDFNLNRMTVLRL